MSFKTYINTKCIYKLQEHIGYTGVWIGRSNKS